MKKLNYLLPLASAFALPVMASTADQPGYSAYGVSNHHAMSMHGVNAAVPAVYAKEGFAFFDIFNVNVQAEAGDVNFVDEIEELIDILDEDDITLDEATEIIDRFNEILPIAGEQGYGNIHLSSDLPLSFQYKNDVGTFTFGTQMSAFLHSIVLDDEVRYNELQQTIETNSSGYVKAAEKLQVSLGYSRQINESKYGALFAGVRANLVQYGLSKQVISFEAADSDEDLGDIILDDYEDNIEREVGVTLDASAFFLSQNYSLGLNILNINQPSFKFGDIGKNCEEKPTEAAQINCYTAQYFSDRIALSETYKADAYVTAQASIFNDSQSMAIDFSIETEHNIPVGIEEQWASVSVSGRPESKYIPNLSLTYSKNLVGTELSYLSGNLGWGIFNLSLGAALEDTEIDGDKSPRGVFIGLSLNKAI